MHVRFRDSEPSESEYFEAFNKISNSCNCWFVLIVCLEIVIHYCTALQTSLFENPQTIEHIFGHFSTENDSMLINETILRLDCSQLKDLTPNKELESVCQREDLAFDLIFFRNIGFTLGAAIGGILADLYGRRISSIYWSICWIFISSILIFMPNMISLKICYMFAVSCSAAITAVTFVNFGEIASKKNRILTIYTIHGSSTATLLLKIVILNITVWRYLLIFTTVSSSITIFICWYIPESPRWYLNKYKQYEAYKLLYEISGFVYEPINISENKKANIGKTLCGMFKFLFTKKLKYFLLVCLLTAVSVTQYSCAKAKTLLDYVTRRDSGVLSFTVQTASYLFITPVYIFLGKRYGLLFISCLMSITTLMALIIQNDGMEIYYTRFAVLLGSSTTHLLYLYVLDIFPTFLRATVFGICVSIYGLGFTGGVIIVKEVEGFSTFNYYLTCFLIGILQLLVILLPSTIKGDLPNYKLEISDVGSKCVPTNEKKKRN